MNSQKMLLLICICLSALATLLLSGCAKSTSIDLPNNSPLSESTSADPEASTPKDETASTPPATDGSERISSDPASDLSDTVLSQAVAEAVTDFTLRLFKEGMKENENQLISPLSVIYALGMTANGAANETLVQMENVLGMSREEVNSFLSAYMQELPDNEKYSLHLANAIWFKDDASFHLEDSFLQTNAEYYQSELYKSPFDASTVTEINDYVKKHTDEMIPQIVEQIPEDAVMYLVNALAFDAKWQEPYTEYQIKEGLFTTGAGVETTVDFMYSEENQYLSDDKAQGFLKYYADGKYAFAALLPNETISPKDYIDSLTGEKLHTLLNTPQHATINAAIPQFETEYKTEMSSLLRNLGMTDAFHPDYADFSALGHYENANLCINRILHKTYLAVDEQGTKAGAATAVEMVRTTALLEPEEPKIIHLNRPFVYLLIDCEHQTPLFIGTLTAP